MHAVSFEIQFNRLLGNRLQWQESTTTTTTTKAVAFSYSRPSHPPLYWLFRIINYSGWYTRVGRITGSGLRSRKQQRDPHCNRPVKCIFAKLPAACEWTRCDTARPIRKFVPKSRLHRTYAITFNQTVCCLQATVCRCGYWTHDLTAHSIPISLSPSLFRY